MCTIDHDQPTTDGIALRKPIGHKARSHHAGTAKRALLVDAVRVRQGAGDFAHREVGWGQGNENELAVREKWF